jgi:hypothetical protein
MNLWKSIRNPSAEKNQKISNSLKKSIRTSKLIYNPNDSKISQDSSSVFKLSNNKTKSKIDPTQIFSSNLSKSGLVPGKNDFNSKNMVEINKTNNFIDKLISSVADNEKKQKRRKSSFPLNNGIDETKNEENLVKKLAKFEEKLNHFTFCSPNEKGENFVLVDKKFSDNLKTENETLNTKMTTLKYQLLEAKETYNKVAAEVTFLKQLNESQQKLKTENTKRSKILEKEIDDTKLINEQLKNVLTWRKLEKDDLERAISNYTKLIDPKFMEDMTDLYKRYNNQYFMATYKPTDEKEVQKLLGQITFLEKQIALKNNEISGLDRFLKVEIKKTEEKEEIVIKDSTKSLRRSMSKPK